MDHIAFMQFLQNVEAERGDAHARVTRAYPGHDGSSVLIHLPQSAWEYSEWLEQHHGIAFQDWVQHCQANPFEDWCLSKLLLYWLWADECDRYCKGLPTPSRQEPDGFEPFGVAVNDR